MENLKKLQETLATYEEQCKLIEKATDYSTIDQAETKGVSALQLIQLQAVKLGDDLYHVARSRRNTMRLEANRRVFMSNKEEAPVVAPKVVEKPVEKPVAKPEPKAKAIAKKAKK